MATNIDNLLLKTVTEIEETAEEILTDKQKIISLDQKRQKTREAVRKLQKAKTDKSWLCFGNLFIKLPRKTAVNLLEKDYDELDNEISDTQKKMKPKVNKLRDLEYKDDIKGFNLNPLSKEELKAIEQFL